MPSPMDLLINESTGEIDHAMVVEAADLRAAREWGGPNPPPNYIRESVSYTVERARLMRQQWRSAHGLDPWEGVEMATMNVPTWGDSGDSFGK